MDQRLVELIGQMAVADALGLPESTNEAQALCEASGFDWLAIVRWLADNRETISNIVKEVVGLFGSFPRPAPTAEEAAATPPALDLSTILLLLTTLAPMIQKLLQQIWDRRHPTPVPPPTV